MCFVLPNGKNTLNWADVVWRFFCSQSTRCCFKLPPGAGETEQSEGSFLSQFLSYFCGCSASWVTTYRGSRTRTEMGGWMENSNLSHSITLFCIFGPNVTNANREMDLWNVCLANWSKGYSLWSPNAIIALAAADLGSFCFLRLLENDAGLSEFRHTYNGNLTALGV